MKETIEKNVITNEQENIMENNTNTNEQENIMENNTNTNEQENAINNENINNNKSVIDTIITALSGIVVNYEKYNVMQNDVIEMKSVIDTIKNENIKNTMLAELHNMENNTENERKNAIKNTQNEIIAYIMEKLDLSCNTKKSNVSRKSNVSSEKTTNTNKYSYLDAILDNIGTGWINPSDLAQKIKQAGKLEQANSNPRFAGALANTLSSAVKSGKLEYNEKNHQYKLA